jgi:hypothetical protein
MKTEKLFICKNTMFICADPDGSGVGAAPVEVFCDMKTGTTRIDHELLDQVLVHKSHTRWCSCRSILRYEDRDNLHNPRAS